MSEHAEATDSKRDAFQAFEAAVRQHRLANEAHAAATRAHQAAIDTLDVTREALGEADVALSRAQSRLRETVK